MKVSKDVVRAVAASRGWVIVRRCPSCGHERWRPVLRAERDCCLAQCGACDLVFLNPRPPKTDAASGYDPDHADQLIPRLVATGLLSENLTPNADRMRKRYGKLIELTEMLQPTEPVVDIGCGIGTSTLALHSHGIAAVGLEIDPNFVEAAQTRLGVDVQLGDVEHPRPRPAAVATLNSVLEHIDEPVPFLEAIRDNVLGPSGALVTTVPNLASTEFVHHGTGWTIISPKHVSYFTEATLRSTAERAGFTVEHVWTPAKAPRPTDPVELWTRIGLGHQGNVTGGIGMVLRSG